MIAQLRSFTILNHNEVMTSFDPLSKHTVDTFFGNGRCTSQKREIDQANNKQTIELTRNILL